MDFTQWGAEGAQLKVKVNFIKEKREFHAEFLSWNDDQLAEKLKEGTKLELLGNDRHALDRFFDKGVEIWKIICGNEKYIDVLAKTFPEKLFSGFAYSEPNKMEEVVRLTLKNISLPSVRECVLTFLKSFSSTHSLLMQGEHFYCLFRNINYSELFDSEVANELDEIILKVRKVREAKAQLHKNKDGSRALSFILDDKNNIRFFNNYELRELNADAWSAIFGDEFRRGLFVDSFQHIKIMLRWGVFAHRIAESQAERKVRLHIQYINDPKMRSLISEGLILKGADDLERTSDTIFGLFESIDYPALYNVYDDQGTLTDNTGEKLAKIIQDVKAQRDERNVG